MDGNVNTRKFSFNETKQTLVACFSRFPFLHNIIACVSVHVILIPTVCTICRIGRGGQKGEHGLRLLD